MPRKGTIKILMIGINNSTFLNRRILRLLNYDIIIYVLKKLDKKEIGQNKNLKSLTKVNPINIFFHPRDFNKHLLSILFDKWTIKEKIKLTLKYIQAIHCEANLIHIQWIAHVPDYAWLKKVFGIPITASVRGSMVTIYPFKHEGYEEKLRQAFNLADRLHFVSKGLMDFCIKRYQLNPEKCFVNYNGIDTSKFKPSEKGKKESEKIVLISVGALIWRKNFQDLIKIVQQSKNLSNIELRIIGEGEERFILEFMINKYQLNKQIKLLGKQSEEQIIEQLQDADIYLSTSYAEGLSNAVMEAASCGLPVIAFDCEGMDEIIVDNESGFIIAHGRTDLFAATLDQLIENPRLREKMGKAARQHVETNFQEDVHVEAMITEYQRTIEKFRLSGNQKS